MLEILIIVGFIIGCYTGIVKMNTSQKVIENKSLIEYFLR